MSAPENGQGAVNEAKTDLKSPLKCQKKSPFENSADNSRFSGCCADFPLKSRLRR